MPTPIHQKVDLLQGDSLTVLRDLPDNSIDAVVTDPPYGLSDHGLTDVVDCLAAWIHGQPYLPRTAKKGFMGKPWDAWVPGPELWREVLRVLKPGGHALVFAGTRSMDLMSIALRLSGFELRDSIGHAHDDAGHGPLMAWVHGQGFPKSVNVFRAIAEKFGDADAAQAWHGWGTALKPAWEPILLCRKPLIERTIADNVLRHGTGALNIDGCRVPTGMEDGQIQSCVLPPDRRESAEGRDLDTAHATHCQSAQPAGRWPANVIHDGSPDVMAVFPESAGQLANVSRRRADKFRNTYGAFKGCDERSEKRGDSGSAARFFYCAKPSRAEKNAGVEDTHAGQCSPGSRNTHPTVKPVELCRYLCRLITPVGGVVLDPFMGSGTTGVAAILEGFGFVGIDAELDFVDVARARCAHAEREVNTQTQLSTQTQFDLFSCS